MKLRLWHIYCVNALMYHFLQNMEVAGTSQNFFGFFRHFIPNVGSNNSPICCLFLCNITMNIFLQMCSLTASLMLGNNFLTVHNLVMAKNELVFKSEHLMCAVYNVCHVSFPNQPF